MYGDSQSKDVVYMHKVTTYDTTLTLMDNLG